MLALVHDGPASHSPVHVNASHRGLILTQLTRRTPRQRLRGLITSAALAVLFVAAVALFGLDERVKHQNRAACLECGVACASCRSQSIQHVSSSLDETRIEFATAGLQLRLTEAAYLQLPRQREEVPDYQRHASAPGPRVPLVQKALTIRTRKRSGSIVATTRLGTAAIDFNATADVRLVIAIPSEATTKSRQRRDAIRATWAKHATSVHPGIIIRFIVGQPPHSAAPDETLQPQLLVLQEEVSRHDDIVMVRGEDTYRNLPSKTVNSLRYMLSLPSHWTHVLKADEDSYIRVHRLLQSLINPSTGRAFHHGLYLGNLENKHGFRVNRNPDSKWYISQEAMSDASAKEIENTLYMAGWGYVLSRDCANIIVSRYDEYAANSQLRPSWFPPAMPHEDVMVALLLRDYIQWPMMSAAFRAAWASCVSGTAVKHLDVDAPILFEGLAAQEASGLWDAKSVQCSTGPFPPGDYHGWYEWRQTLPVARI